MARQIRIEYPGALHHVRSRGNNRQDIFLDDTDRRKFLELLGEAVRRYDWLIYAYVLMTNHFHLEIETPLANLADGMRWMLGKYVQWFNKRHECEGHLFGDRYHSDLIESEAYLTAVARYIVLNPVRANMAAHPGLYRWSSYRATAGLEPAPKWLAVHPLASHFGIAETWQANYTAYVEEKIGSKERLWDNLVAGMFLGSESWLKEIRKMVESKPRSDVHPYAQRAIGHPAMHQIIPAVARAFHTTAAAIRESRGGVARMIAAWLGWYEGLLRARSIAAALRLRSSGHITDLVAECERRLCRDPDLRQRVDIALAAMA